MSLVLIEETLLLLEHHPSFPQSVRLSASCPDIP